MRGLLFIFLCLVISGCASMEWKHPTKSMQVFYGEKLACEEIANNLSWQRYPQPVATTHVQQTVNVGSDSSSSSSKGISDSDSYKRKRYQREKLKECLFSKGWTLEKREK